MLCFQFWVWCIYPLALMIAWLAQCQWSDPDGYGQNWSVPNHNKYIKNIKISTLIARFMGPTWDPSGADRTQAGPMLAPWILPSRNSLQNSRVEFPSSSEFRRPWGDRGREQVPLLWCHHCFSYVMIYRWDITICNMATEVMLIALFATLALDTGDFCMYSH